MKSAAQFQANQIILINNESFEISKIDGPFLQGTKEGDPSFLKGKRSIVAAELVKSGKGFKYDWNAK